MPLRAVTITDIYVELNRGGRTFRFNYADLPPGNFARKAEAARAALQAWIDDRLLLADMPADDPARISDPGLPHFFWGKLDGTPDPAGPYLIGREVIVDSVTWDGTRVNLATRRA